MQLSGAFPLSNALCSARTVSSNRCFKETSGLRIPTSISLACQACSTSAFGTSEAQQPQLSHGSSRHTLPACRPAGPTPRRPNVLPARRPSGPTPLRPAALPARPQRCRAPHGAARPSRDRSQQLGKSGPRVEEAPQRPSRGSVPAPVPAWPCALRPPPQRHRRPQRQTRPDG